MPAIGNERDRNAFPTAGALFNRSGECPHAATLETAPSPMMLRTPRGFVPFADSTRYPDSLLAEMCLRREACKSAMQHEQRQRGATSRYRQIILETHNEIHRAMDWPADC